MQISRLSYKTSLWLFSITILLFLLVNFLFKDSTYLDLYSFQYYRTSLFVNCFVLPSLYGLFVFRLLFKHNKPEKKIFLDNFRNAFVSSFLGGFFSVVFIYLFLNFFDPVAIEILKEQHVNMMLSFAPSEQEKLAMMEKINFETIKNINPFGIRNLFGIFFTLVILFYLFISFILASFFKK